MGTTLWIFTKAVAELERDDYGVYELLGHSDNILYIGHGRIQCSLLEHFADGKNPIDSVFNFSVEYTWNEQKAIKRQNEELDKYYKAYSRYPRFNK